MTRKYNYCLFVGRFQPFHNEHYHTVVQALNEADTVIIALGSANRSRNIRDPWNTAERESMIRSCFDTEANQRLRFIAINDHLYNNEQWAANVSSAVKSLITGEFSDVAIIGANKDETSFYFTLFPQFARIETKIEKNLDATGIREMIFDGRDDYVASVPKAVSRWIDKWISENPHIYSDLCQEYAFICQYRALWDSAPYAPTFVTTDAVVVCCNHVLMVERRAQPGKGLLALPGGFLNPAERIQDGCIRELKEETKIKVPEAVLRGSIAGSGVFDHPRRSLRGRTITHAFYIKLSDQTLPKVKGGDDAAVAMWVPLHDLKNLTKTIYEDHAFIVEYFTGVSL